MASPNKIILAIDEFLKKNKLKATTPVEVSPYLEKKGILNNSTSRPGAPLRNILRKGIIEHAWQNGNKWFIPHSGQNERKLVTPTKKEIPNKKTATKKQLSASKEHKLTGMALAICSFLEEKYTEKAEYFLEYKPDWLLSYPTPGLIQERSQIKDLYSELVNGKLDLETVINLLPDKKLQQRQSYDIWIGPPYNFAVEFDEKQHFNQYRKITLRHYDHMRVNYSLPQYMELTKNTTIKPGLSGFTKLKSADPLFPDLLPGEAQDNRIRQRAFRDYLKDILPLANEKNPTVRIPYHVTGKKINNFNKNDFNAVKTYLKSIEIQWSI